MRQLLDDLIATAAERNLLASVEILRAESDVLNHAVAAALGGDNCIEIARLAQLPPALARLVVIRLAEEAAGAPVPSIGARIPELLALAPKGGSASLDIGAGIRAHVEYGVLRFATADAPQTPLETTLPLPGSATFGTWSLQATVTDASTATTRVVDVVLDADRLKDGLTVRAWRPGDRMRPLGLAGSKTLSDLFTDRRVPRAQRALMPVLLSDSEIAWVPGVATAEEFRVREGTRRLALLRADHA